LTNSDVILVLGLSSTGAFVANDINVINIIISFCLKLGVSENSQVTIGVRFVASLLQNLTFLDSWASIVNLEESVPVVSNVLISSC
jgi:hypothetical protein